MGNPMQKPALKAIFSILTLSRTEKGKPDWDRLIVIFSTAVTIGLVAIYVFGKATSRW